MKHAKPLVVAVALASLSLPACGGTSAEDEGPIADTQQAEFGWGWGWKGGPPVCKALTGNGLVENALTANALTANALTANALTANALTANALTANALTANALSDPNARDVLSYIVSCALGPDQSVDVTVDGQDYSYQGQLGLAPEWGDANGSCGTTCQGWVSGCVLARLDYLGVHREISVRGDAPGLVACLPELLTYTQREATYYGNIFTSPQQRYACLSPGQTEIPRVCGASDDNCVVDVVGSCANSCDWPTWDGAFQNCRAGDGDHDDPSYHGSVTVYLKP